MNEDKRRFWLKSFRATVKENEGLYYVVSNDASMNIFPIADKGRAELLAKLMNLVAVQEYNESKTKITYS